MVNLKNEGLHTRNAILFIQNGIDIVCTIERRYYLELFWAFQPFYFYFVSYTFLFVFMQAYQLVFHYCVSSCMSVVVLMS